MVISTNPIPPISEFRSLLSRTLESLITDSRSKPKSYLSLDGKKFEFVVAKSLNANAEGTPFENSIDLVSGQKFPDIVARKFYGVEVKTTKSNHWKTTGSSIAEGTRVDGVERIFMLFGKICNPIEFKCKPYEECLSEVVVTHSPRYLIDMDIETGNTIFDKIKIPYDKLRKQDNPIKTILNYYREKLQPGETTWWLDQDSSQPPGLIIRIWNNLSIKERDDYRLNGFCFFPEVLSEKSTKYNKFAIWLSNKKGIICPNTRDIFSAGGQGSLTFRSKIYRKIPKIIVKLLNDLPQIYNLIENTDSNTLSEYWDTKVSERNKHTTWIDLIVENSKSKINPSLMSKIIYSKFLEFS